MKDYLASFNHFSLEKKNSHAFEILVFLAYLKNNYALHRHSDILIYFAFLISKTNSKIWLSILDIAPESSFGMLC